MTNFGYTLMTEQSGPRDLVRYAVAAEQAGFDGYAVRDEVVKSAREVVK